MRLGVGDNQEAHATPTSTDISYKTIVITSPKPIGYWVFKRSKEMKVHPLENTQEVYKVN
jgi:hypothetical protein